MNKSDRVPLLMRFVASEGYSKHTYNHIISDSIKFRGGKQSKRIGNDALEKYNFLKIIVILLTFKFICH